MPYTTPVYDRTQADVDDKTTKGYFNVSDWTRIYGNAGYIYGILTSLGQVFSYPTIATQTRSSIPKVSDFNSLLTFISATQTWVANGMGVTFPATIKTDWEAGLNKQSPNYIDVNNWERIIDLINSNISTLSNPRHARTGLARTGAGMTRQNGFRR